MAKAAIVLWILVGGAIAGTLTQDLFATLDQAAQSSRRFRANDKQLRGWASTSPPPVYPPASLEKKVSGVAVAKIRIDPKGATEGIEIVQAPDAAIGRAVHDAVMQWTFKPPLAMSGEGVLVFYFHLTGQKGAVLSPAEMRDLTNPGAKGMARADEPPIKSITEPEFRSLSSRLDPLVLDIRDRETFAEGHEKGAVNIPFTEALTRAPAELPVSRPIVIDCRDPLDVCAMVVHWLRSSGFRGEVSVLRR